MRIALVTTYPPGAGSLNEYAYHFVQALRHKPEVTELILLVDHLPAGEHYPQPEEGPTAGAPMQILPCWRFDAWQNPLTILSAVARVKPDAVLFNLQFATFGRGKVAASSGLSTPKLVKLAGYPTIVLLHNIMETVDLASAGFVKSRLMEQIVRGAGSLVTQMVLGADLVALTIPKYVEILAEKYGADNVWLAPHGSFEEGEPLPEQEETDRPHQILTFGKFGTYKRVEPLIKALIQLEAEGCAPLELVIAGTDSPNAAGYLEQMRARYGHLAQIRFTGYVAEEEIPQLFRSAAMVVFPYTSTTGSSGVLHQAGSYAKAAVLPKIGDFQEVIREEGYTGEFFDPGDSESLAAAIRRLLEEPARRTELGRQNYLASQGLSLADVVDWYLIHLATLLRPEARPARSLRPLQDPFDMAAARPI